MVFDRVVERLMSMLAPELPEDEDGGFNPLICSKYRYIYIHIPKTAGNSIGALLGSLRRSPRERQPSYRIHKHSKPAKVRELVGEEVWNGHFKFAFVRNPWDLMVSCYHWWHHSGQKFAHTRAQANQVIALGSFRNFMLSEFGRTMINECRGNIFDWISQDGAVALDFVGRFERIDEDWKTICCRLGIDFMPLPHLNRSKREDYRTYYDTETAAIVASRFQKTIELFGYRFDDAATNS